MKKIQTENGYTRIANELMEALMRMRLNGYEYSIALAIIRQTYGYNKKQDKIKLAKISELTGIAVPLVSRTIKKLITYSIVIKLDNLLRLNKDITAWKVIKTGNSQKVINLDKKKLSKQITRIYIKDKKDKKNTSYSSGADAPQRVILKNPEIDRIIDDFKKITGHIPADKYPRRVAQNIRQITSTFLRVHSTLFLELRGQELTKDYIFEKFYLNLMQKKYLADIEKLETVKLKLKVYLDLIAQKLEAEKKAKSLISMPGYEQRPVYN